ncbi:hypothetical protein N9M57_03170 [Opitutales bacterium]|nr:hypothetical protein [Opitutales bacterium]
MKKDSNISEISKGGNQEDDFIVKLDFYYSEVTYEGFLILSRREISELLEALDGERELYTPNMPGDWCEEFDISLLKDAFTIHSSGKEDIAAMRSVFGDSVGNTELYDQIVEGEDEEDQDTDGELVAAIDCEVAQRFIEDADSIDLSAASSIDEAAAVVLSKFEGWLCLDGLTELSDSTVEVLAKQEGTLSLDGLSELSDAAAEALSKHEGTLYLNGLTELSDAAAEALSNHEDGTLNLDGLTELSDAAAETLSKHQDFISLNGLTELSDAAAKALSNHEDVLSLDGLFELSDAAAEALSKSKSDLYLCGLTELSDVALVALSQHKGKLGLDGLTELSDAAAEAFAKHKGEICGMAPAEWVASLD